MSSEQHTLHTWAGLFASPERMKKESFLRRIQCHLIPFKIIYPWVAFFLALSWTHNSLLVYQVSGFLDEISTIDHKFQSTKINAIGIIFDLSNKLIFGVTSLASLLS